RRHRPRREAEAGLVGLRSVSEPAYPGLRTSRGNEDFGKPDEGATGRGAKPKRAWWACARFPNLRIPGFEPAV
ncbi:hypothetical protein CQA81_31710, partial [Klebsiella pneumoniae]